MTSLPYMQLYVSDYLADTAHLTAEQHGAYMLLLMNYWQRGKPLDNTGERLAYVARMTPDEWLDNKEILAEFFWVDGDLWTHARVENDLSKVRDKSEQASFAGKKSAAQRTLNDRSTNDEQPLNHKDKDKDIDIDITAYFESFWNIYPLKIGKSAGYKAYIKAIKRSTPKLIFEGVQRYANDPNRDPAFTAHASTWLNGDRWADSPLPDKRSRMDFKHSSEPTRIPPRFSADDVPKGEPMPDSVRELLARKP